MRTSSNANIARVYVQLELRQSLILKTNENNSNQDQYPFYKKQIHRLKGNWDLKFVTDSQPIPIGTLIVFRNHGDPIIMIKKTKLKFGFLI